MANELRSLLRERAHGVATLDELPFKPFDFAELVELASSGRASRTAARTILREMLRTPRAPRELLRTLGLERIEEGPELDELCRRALEARPAALADLRAGKLRALEALLGAALALSGGRAHPDAARATLVRLVQEERP
ncbi:MAG: GatB/YqeY domain-containing protein [Planctomycetota bacterium]